MINRSLLLALTTFSVVLAQDPLPSPAPTTTGPPAPPSPAFTPLASKHFEWNNLPYKADTDTGGERGAQFGYNRCNSTTEGTSSLCQTAVINGIDDFCIWGPPEPDSLIGNTEGEAVAWCTKPGHGTRIIPAGAITGVQFVRTPDYVQVTGVIHQRFVNIATDDSGGEMDPHGADQRGNPLGGLLFTNAFPASGGNANNYIQAIEWHNFMGEGLFCLKACDPARPNAARFCEHIYDRIGCWYNAPAPYQEDVFESCLGDNQDFPGIYTGANGQTSTYTQPPESLGEIATMPYQPRRPATSQCTTFSSAALYAGAPSPSVPIPSRTLSGTTTRATTSARATSVSRSVSQTGAAIKVSPGATLSLIMGIAGAGLALML